MELGHIPQMFLTPALTAALARASDVAVAAGAREMAIEHLLFALCDDPDAISVLETSRVDVAQLKVETAAYLSAPHPGQRSAAREAAPSSDTARILEAAAAAARGGRRRDINGAIVLAAIVGDGRSFAAHLLHNHGLTFDEAIRALQRSLAQSPSREPQAYVPPADDVLARARERVQSRSQPTLRDLIGERGRQEAPLAPIPDPAPTPYAGEAAPAAEPALEPATEPGAERTPKAEPDESDATHMEALARAESELNAAIEDVRAQERVPEPREEPSKAEPLPQSSPAPDAQPPPDAVEATSNAAVVAPTVDAAVLPEREFEIPRDENFGYAQPRAPFEPTFEPSAPAPFPYPAARADSLPPQGPSTVYIPRPFPVQPPPIPPPPPGWTGRPQRPDADAFPFPYRAAPAPTPSPRPSSDWPAPRGPQDAFSGPVEPTFGEPPPYVPPPGPGQYAPSPDFGNSPPPGYGGRPQFPVHELPVGIEARGPAAQPTFSPDPPAAPRNRASSPLEAGQLSENIPRVMRVAQTERVEIRIANAAAKAIADNLDGGGAAWRHDIIITKAMSVRLRAPDGGFFIETASPETQWIENQLGLASDDFASWRFLVTAQERGRSRLQIVVSARTLGHDGIAAETALPDQIVDVKVRTNFKRSLARWLGWIVAAMIGGAFAKFGESGIDIANQYIAKFMN